MILKKFKKTSIKDSNGFSVTNSIEWGRERNHFVMNFIDSFQATMKRKYDYLVFLDLSSDSGYIECDGKYTEGVSLQVMKKEQFSKHIFFVKEKNEADALNVRIRKNYPKSNYLIFNESINSGIEKLIKYIPESNNKHKVASLALITVQDPDVEFETFKILHDLGINILLLFHLPWKEKEYYKFCMDEERELLNSFLPQKWSNIEQSFPITDNESFFRILAKSLHQGISELGYKASGSFYRLNEKEALDLMFMGQYFSVKGAKKIQKEFSENINTQVSLF